MPRILKEEIQKSFSNLLNREGFKETNYDYDAEAFGNETVVLQSKTHMLRFATDRGDVYIDIGVVSRKTDWILLDSVLEFLGNPTIKPGPNDLSRRLKELADKLDAHLDEVKRALCADNIKETKKGIEAIGRGKAVAAGLVTA